MGIINRIKCFFYGHDKVYYYNRQDNYIVECKRCGQVNEWSFYNADMENDKHNRLVLHDKNES